MIVLMTSLIILLMVLVILGIMSLAVYKFVKFLFSLTF